MCNGPVAQRENQRHSTISLIAPVFLWLGARYSTSPRTYLTLACSVNNSLDSISYWQTIPKIGVIGDTVALGSMTMI